MSETQLSAKIPPFQTVLICVLEDTLVFIQVLFLQCLFISQSTAD